MASSSTSSLASAPEIVVQRVHAHRWTTIPTVSLRDVRLSFRARGLLAYLLSVPPGWRTSAEKLATEAPEGRDAIRSALTELEIHQYLRRTRLQSGGGRWYTTWTITDTAGDFTDDGIPVVGVTSADTPSGQLGPTTENQPSVGQPLESRPQRHSTEDVVLRDSSSCPPRGPVPTAHRRRIGEELSEQQQRADQLLQDLPDPWRLTAAHRTRLRPLVTRALDAGWSAEDLARHLSTNPGGVKIPWRVLHTRLETLPAAARRAPAVRRPDWCGTCDERTRLLEYDTGFARCPACHPLEVVAGVHA
jgi:hypothetical protein